MEEIIPSDWNAINTLNAIPISVLPAFAECPWPHPDSHCSPCSIYLSDPSKRTGFNIWGEYYGDANRKSFYAQTSCTDMGPGGQIKRFFCLVDRTKTPSPPEGDGLFIGLVEQETLNDPAKLFDPSTWVYAGYLADLPGGTPTEQYSICVTANIVWPSTRSLFLLMCTNGSYEGVGWRMGGFSWTGFEGLPLWRYMLNEPGEPDGWEQQDNSWRGCFVPYTQGAGALVEGYCQMENPNFPGTAQEGTPYNYSFDVSQQTAFPCGCPETILWQLWDRDTNQPLHDPVQYLLDCGYTGVNGFGGTISFTGSGTFHGQLKVGHKTNGSWAVDDTYDFDVIIGEYPCSHWTNQTECQAHNCYWCDGQCQSTPCNGEIYLKECVTCDWVDGCDHGPMKTTFTTDETVHCSRILWSDTPRNWYGDIIGYRWFHNGILRKEKFTSCPVDGMYNGMCNHCWWDTPTPGTGYIEAYWNGNYMGKSNDYTVEGPQEDVIATILPSSVFYTGPFPPGLLRLVASVDIKNIGNKTGNIYYKLVEYPNTPDEHQIIASQTYLNPGQQTTKNHNINIPTTPGTWPLGYKVWGETEDEPSWGTMKTKQFNIKL